MSDNEDAIIAQQRYQSIEEWTTAGGDIRDVTVRLLFSDYVTVVDERTVTAYDSQLKPGQRVMVWFDAAHDYHMWEGTVGEWDDTRGWLITLDPEYAL